MRLAQCIMLLFLAVAVPALQAAEPQGTADQQFIDGLRERHLYRLAQTFCLEQLARTDLSEARRAQLVVQLSQSFAEHALHTKPGERDPLWQQAAKVTEQFATEYPESIQWPKVRLQTALVYLAHGESLRRQLELSSKPGDLPEKAYDSLRAAIDITDQLDQMLDSRLRAVSRPSSVPHEEFSEGELRWLQIQAQFYRGLASRNQGELFPMGSPDRVAALRSAIERFEALSKLDDSQAMAWKSRVEMIACYRLMGNLAEAGRHLQHWTASEPPAVVQTELQTQGLLLDLAQDNLTAAVKRIQQHEQDDWQRTAEWDDAVLQVCLAVSTAAAAQGDVAQATAWRNQAVARLPQIARHGQFWKRRAETQLARSVSNDVQSPDELQTLVRAAAGFYRSGEFDEAVAAYDRARVAANQQGQSDQFFDLSLTAAAIEQEQDHHAAAAKRFRELSLAVPGNDRAAEAHMTAVYNCAQAARAHRPVVLDEYLAWLDEHIRTWPEAASSDQARWLLARVYQQQGQWDQAIATLQGISAENEQFVPALKLLADCYEAKIAATTEAGEDASSTATEATQWFKQLVVGSDNRWPERWSPAHREAALLAAQFLLLHSNDPRGAEQLLQQAMSQAGGATEAWTAKANGLLALSLAGQGRSDEAIPLLEQLLNAPAEQRLELLLGLEGLGRGNASSSNELSAVRLKLAQSLEPDQHTISVEERRQWQLAWARALAAAGQTEDASRRYAALLEAQSDNQAAQYEYAQLLADSSDRASLQRALKLWLDVLAGADPQSQRWFEAKYHLARTHFQLGDPGRAAKIIRLTQVLHPELGTPQLKQQFTELLARCQAEGVQ